MEPTPRDEKSDHLETEEDLMEDLSEPPVMNQKATSDLQPQFNPKSAGNPTQMLEREMDDIL